jgi:hypothetical protein
MNYEKLIYLRIMDMKISDKFSAFSTGPYSLALVTGMPELINISGGFFWIWLRDQRSAQRDDMWEACNYL